VVLAVVSLAVPSGAASAQPSHLTCRGGSIPGGVYESVTVRGHCSLDAGTVIVGGNVVVARRAVLLAAFGGSDLVVRQDVIVRRRGILVLGCEPNAFTCFNDPNQNNPTMSTNDRIGGSLIGWRPLMMLVHKSIVAGSILQYRGGGGITCSVFPLGKNGPPAYSTYEDNFVARGVVVSGLRTCWFGFIRNTVVHDVVLHRNRLADPDGNEVVSNIIGGDLRCSANNPDAQLGDSGGSLNIVAGRATGECRALTQGAA
jgi:hypothetical protein